MSNTEVRPKAEPQRPTVKSIYAYATMGAKTTQGGEITSASTGIYIAMNGADLRVACAGDVVSYEDGSQNKIVSGTDWAACFNDQPVAIVGSHIGSGDTMITSPQDIMQINVHLGASIPGFVILGYLPAVPCQEQTP